MNQKTSFYYLAAGIAIGAMLMAAQPGLAQKIILAAVKPAASQPALTDEQQAIAAVRAVKPAVVNIIGITNSASPGSNSQPQISASPQEVEGTGFIIDTNGLIVTNNHVVEDTSMSYTVMFADGTQYDATVVGHDQFDDIALVKINAHNLPVAALGDSGALETGQTVFAIGNSLGQYQNSVTRGVVSALGRSVDAATDNSPRMQQLIQTDAAINPGNSGGPLITMAGEVVGMNTMIDTRGESLGFAIPINEIKSVVQQLQTFGKASRPYVGISFETITKGFTQAALPSGVTAGAYVAAVSPGGPADAAGVKTGDVITAVNGEKLTQVNEIDSVIAEYQAGNQVTLTVIRGSQTLQLQLILSQFQ